MNKRATQTFATIFAIGLAIVIYGGATFTHAATQTRPFDINSACQSKGGTPGSIVWNIFDRPNSHIICHFGLQWGGTSQTQQSAGNAIGAVSAWGLSEVAAARTPGNPWARGGAAIAGVVVAEVVGNVQLPYDQQVSFNEACSSSYGVGWNYQDGMCVY